jgi:hypothetical protein
MICHPNANRNERITCSRSAANISNLNMTAMATTVTATTAMVLASQKMENEAGPSDITVLLRTVDFAARVCIRSWAARTNC